MPVGVPVGALVPVGSGARVFGGRVAVGGAVGAPAVDETAPEVAVTGGISAVGGCSGMMRAGPVDAGDGDTRPGEAAGDAAPGLSCPAAPDAGTRVGGD